MIHVRAWKGSEDEGAVREDDTLQITLTGLTDIRQLQVVLNRCLNCAPEFGSDWFELSDRVHKFINNAEAARRAAKRAAKETT